MLIIFIFNFLIFIKIEKNLFYLYFFKYNMNTNIVLGTEFPEFIKNNYHKKDKELLNDFKNHINYVIIQISNNYLISYETFNDNNFIFNDLYISLIKIKFYLTQLEIKDKNQTNKYQYEKCLQTASLININNISRILEKVHCFGDNDLELENETIINISKISSNLNNSFDDHCQKLITKYKDNINKQVINNHTLKVLEYNNFLNYILIEIVGINEIIKDVNISTNDY